MKPIRLDVGDIGDEVTRLHENLKKNGFDISPEEVKRKFFGPSTREAVQKCQKKHGLSATGCMDEDTAKAIVAESKAMPTGSVESKADKNAPLLSSFSAVQPKASPGGTSTPSGTEKDEYHIEGKVASRSHAGVGGLRVEIVDKNVGEDVRLAETVTDDGGRYQATFTVAQLYQRGKKRPDLQARVFSRETFLGASDVRYNASNREILNILLMEKADAALPSEHETLTSSLFANFRGNLRDLKETDDRQDITYLANKTGWDARAVAIAALADQFSSKTAGADGVPKIEPSFFYVLFRAGIPANENSLYHADAKAVSAVWEQGIKQGVIPAELGKKIPKALEHFQSLATKQVLEGPALAGVSTLKEMLLVSLGDDQAKQKQFADLYTRYRDDLPKFWQSVRGTFGEAAEKRLKVDGQLGYLTLNNAPLIRKLHAAAGRGGLTDTLSLTASGYYRAEKWHAVIGNDPLPPEITGKDDAEKRSRYAELLAAQVRLSYPTAVVAQMVKSKETPLTADEITNQVHSFLSDHQGKFSIGMQPVEQYVKRNNVQVAPEVTKEVTRIQRVYQITPGDDAMNALLKKRVDSAYSVIRYDRDEFVRTFKNEVGGETNARLIHARAQQVHNTVINIATSYLIAGTAPAIGVHSPAGTVNPAPTGPVPANASDIIAYSTLEEILGEMDYCACDHCRSILSPAAYLVNLLQFIDPTPGAWANTVATWRTEHGAPYPYPDNAAWVNSGSPANTDITPLAVLLSRRPDIQHLPLTCENTNKPLPYIDLVNETLEYFVANNSQKLSLNDYLGHDTNGAASEDLLACPQFVMDSAYTTLRNERFPAPLPFHQPLENLRRYFNKFEVPLPLAMDRFRKNNNLDRGANPYGWRDILMEETGLSRDEYEILTDFTAVPLWRMYGFPNGTADADVIAGQSNAKQFARRVGITYEDMVSVLKTRFINPNSDLIPKLERLGVSFATLKALKDGTITDAAFDALLPTGLTAPDPVEYGGDIKAWVKRQDNYNRITGLITLAIPAGTWIASKVYVIGDCVRPTAAQTVSTLYYECTTPGTSAATQPRWPTTPGKPYSDGTVVWTCRDASSCLSFDNMAFRYSDPAKVTQNMGVVEFVRLLRFVRVWKILGWTIEQTDAAITALYPSNPLGNTDIEKLNSGFLTLLPRLGIVIQVMKALNLTVKRDLLPLLACWSDIGTHGTTALYRQMFLNPALLEQDAVFADNGYGEFLTDMTKKLAAHAEAVRSAFNLTGDEYDGIVAALRYDANTALTIPNVSAIFRRGWLGRKLKLSVRELLLLTQLTGLDPFAAPNPTNPAILRFIELVQSMKDRSFKFATALYLIWNQDLSGKSAPDSAQIAAIARTLRLGFAAVETEFAVADDPDGAIAQTRMAMVYGADAASFFFGLLNDTLTVEVEFSDPDGTLVPGVLRQAIENAAGKTDAGSPRIVYDDFRKRLSYSGVLTTATGDAIKLAAGVGAAAFKTAVDNLYNKNQAVIIPFFARYPELQSPYNAYVADTTHSAIEKRSSLLKAILPELVQRRKRQQAFQSVSAVTNTDLAFTQTFLDPLAAPFPLHAVGHDDQSALNDFLALEKQGLSVQFFASDTATGATIPSPDIASKLDYSPLVGAVGNPLPVNPTPGAAISGVWRGYLEAPESGFFNLRIEADAGATVTLILDDKPVTLTQNGTLWNNTDPIELRAGTLYPVKLTVEKVRNVVRVEWDWQPKGQGRTVIPARYLYPAALFDRFQEVYVRFLKAASLATGLGLAAKELAYFATHADYRINAQGQINSNGQGWLNALPNADNLHLTNPADTAIAQNLNAALLTPLCALLDFARIKADISPGDESLLAVLKDPVTATQNTDSLLFTITRWNQTSLNDVLAQFSGNIAVLGHFDLFRRVYDAFAFIQKMGISAKALIQATTNDPTGNTVRDLQAALRARYDENDWLNVLKPINDQMRGLQRDALVAYILHQMRDNPATKHIDTPDKLFEYFLMDVQMEPCMQTSRIRHALSSVQLFIERCLMNLEPRVAASSINAKQWEWMKRYRVWEANRKVFLYPENWLEPELRDDQSPFFKEAMSELLQSDITEDTAATALLNYLSKLEEVAKLEPCGIHYVESDSPTTNNISHVVARTAGANRKYYYRRREGISWTPWEQIKLDIEDNPVIPVVWKGRLFLFWLRILKQVPLTAPSAPPAGKKLQDIEASTLIKSDVPKMTVQVVICWSEYYNGKWQPTKTSDANKAIELGHFDNLNGPLTFDPAGLFAFDRSSLKMDAYETRDKLIVQIIYKSEVRLWFLFYNTHSLPEIDINYMQTEFALISMMLRSGLHRVPETSNSIFQISYAGHNSVRNSLLEVLNMKLYRVVEPYLRSWWNVPFFFDDSRHVFYVTTTTESIKIPKWNPYGVANMTAFTGKPSLPSIIKKGPSLLVGYQDVSTLHPQGGFGVVDTAPIERFVNSGHYINKGLGTPGTVIYGDAEIGLAGKRTGIERV